MDRRRFLAALAGSLVPVAGCVAAPRPDQSDPTRPTATPPPGLQARVTLAGQDAVPGDLELGIEVGMLETAVTDDHPARLRVTTTNHGPARGISVSPGGCRLFDRWDGGSDDPRGLWLHEPGAAETYPRRGDRWTWEQSAAVAGFPDYGCSLRRYAPGESVENEYAVWDDPSVRGYLVPGAYRFEQPVRLGPGDETDGDARPVAEFTWGFDLAVARP